jgi:hypothetical protein
MSRGRPTQKQTSDLGELERIGCSDARAACREGAARRTDAPTRSDFISIDFLPKPPLPSVARRSGR